VTFGCDANSRGRHKGSVKCVHVFVNDPVNGAGRRSGLQPERRDKSLRPFAKAGALRLANRIERSGITSSKHESVFPG
jgi:hypothetical protein